MSTQLPVQEVPTHILWTAEIPVKIKPKSQIAHCALYNLCSSSLCARFISVKCQVDHICGKKIAWKHPLFHSTSGCQQCHLVFEGEAKVAGMLLCFFNHSFQSAARCHTNKGSTFHNNFAILKTYDTSLVQARTNKSLAKQRHSLR